MTNKKAGDCSPACCFNLSGVDGRDLTKLGRESHGFQTSDQTNVLRSRSLRSLAFRVLDSLAFLEFIELDTFDVRHVKKHVFARTVFDESKSLVGQLLDGSFSHYFFRFTSKTLLCQCRPKNISKPTKTTDMERTLYDVLPQTSILK